MRKMDCDFCFRKSKANTSWMSRSLHTWLNLFKESPSINCCSKIYCHAARVIMGKSRFGALEGCNSWIYYRMAWLFLSICLRLFYFFSHWNLLKPIAFLLLFIDLCKLCLCNAFLIEFSILLFFFLQFHHARLFYVYMYFYSLFWHIHTQNFTLPSLALPWGTYRYITVDTCTLTETRLLWWTTRNQINKK